MSGLSAPANLPLLYRLILTCSGVPPHVGAVAAVDINDEFSHRPWHQNVQCIWDGTRLRLHAENDFDATGQALSEEFSDAISACIAEGFDGSIHIESIAVISEL